MFRLSIVGADSADRLARRLLVSAVKLTLSAEEVATGLAHTVEGITTPLLREEAPVDTGALRAGLRAHVDHEGGQLVVRWESDVDYADYVEHGTGLHHVPDAHSAWDGHEGQYPNPFAERAYGRAALPIRAALVAAGTRLLVRFEV